MYVYYGQILLGPFETAVGFGKKKIIYPSASDLATLLSIFGSKLFIQSLFTPAKQRAVCINCRFSAAIQILNNRESHIHFSVKNMIS